MTELMKRFLDWSKSAGFNGSIYDVNLKNGNFTDEEIQEIADDFIINKPDKIMKYGECPRCGSDVACNYLQFESQNFYCDCRLDFTGKEVHNPGIIFIVK